MSTEYSTDYVGEVERTVEKLIKWFPGKFQDVNKDHIQGIGQDASIASGVGGQIIQGEGAVRVY